jgi:hypothetical protein
MAARMAGALKTAESVMTASNAAAVTPDSPLPAGKMGGRGDSALIRFLIAQRFSRQPEFATTTHALGIDKAHSPGDLVDYLFRAEDQPHTHDDVFDRLRWGGQFIYASRDWKKVSKAIDQFADWREAKAWALERRPQTLKKYPFNLRILGVHRNVHFLVARKVLLVKPG